MLMRIYMINTPHVSMNKGFIINNKMVYYEGEELDGVKGDLVMSNNASFVPDEDIPMEYRHVNTNL